MNFDRDCIESIDGLGYLAIFNHPSITLNLPKRLKREEGKEKEWGKEREGGDIYYNINYISVWLYSLQCSFICLWKF